MEPTDIQDFSVSNPGLHRLYVKWAHMHLAVMRKFVSEMTDFSNLNTHEAACLIQNEMSRLIREKAAYRDAAALLLVGDPAPEDDA